MSRTGFTDLLIYRFTDDVPMYLSTYLPLPKETSQWQLKHGQRLPWLHSWCW